MAEARASSAAEARASPWPGPGAADGAAPGSAALTLAPFLPQAILAAQRRGEDVETSKKCGYPRPGRGGAGGRGLGSSARRHRSSGGLPARPRAAPGPLLQAAAGCWGQEAAPPAKPKVALSGAA